jgi:hypothetical protein
MSFKFRFTRARFKTASLSHFEIQFQSRSGISLVVDNLHLAQTLLLSVERLD